MPQKEKKPSSSAAFATPLTATEKMGPALKGLFKKAKLKNGKEASEANVRAIVKAGGNGMPGYEELLSAEEMENLIAYLKTV
jgi:mono/diheme cytochrome c family protein